MGDPAAGGAAHIPVAGDAPAVYPPSLDCYSVYMLGVSTGKETNRVYRKKNSWEINQTTHHFTGGWFFAVARHSVQVGLEGVPLVAPPAVRLKLDSRGAARSKAPHF